MDSALCTAILVVEDEDILRNDLVRLLASDGFHVYAATTVAEAHAKLREMPHPTLVLADFMAPGVEVFSLMSGLHPGDRLAVLPVSVSNAAPHDEGFACSKRPIALDDLLRLAAGLCLRRN